MSTCRLPDTSYASCTQFLGIYCLLRILVQLLLPACHERMGEHVTAVKTWHSTGLQHILQDQRFIF